MQQDSPVSSILFYHGRGAAVNEYRRYYQWRISDSGTGRQYRGYAAVVGKEWKAYQLIIFKHLKGRILPNSINEEDILQCGYFALLAAVKAFKSGEYKFTTYLNYSVQNAINEAINGKSRRPSEHKEVSYNQRIKNADSEDIEMWELMKDETAALLLASFQAILKACDSVYPFFLRSFAILQMFERLNISCTAFPLFAFDFLWWFYHTTVNRII